MTSEPQNAPASAPETESVEAPETTEAETQISVDVEEPTEAPEEVEYQGREALVAPDLSDLPDDIGDDFERAIEATVLEFKEGDIVEGTVVSVDGDGAMIDIGYKSEGLIPTRELSIRNNVDPNDAVKVGERVEAVVLNKEDDEGPSDPLQEAGDVRACLGENPGSRQRRRHRRRNSHRGRQGWSHRRHRPPRVPPGLTGRHASRP